MQVNHVQSCRRHAVEVELEHIERDEMAADVNHQAAPAKTRLILNRDCRRCETIGRYFDQLQECFQSMHHTERRGGLKLSPRSAHWQAVRFILSELLDIFAGMFGMDYQRSVRRVACSRAQRQPGLPRKHMYE